MRGCKKISPRLHKEVTGAVVVVRLAEVVLVVVSVDNVVVNEGAGGECVAIFVFIMLLLLFLYML